MKVVQALVILGVAASSNAANLRGAYLADSNRDVERQTNPDTMVMPGNPSLKSAPFFGETAPAPDVLKRQPVAAPTAFYAEGIARQPEGQGRFVGRDNVAYAEGIARQPEAAKRRDVKPRLDGEIDYTGRYYGVEGIARQPKAAERRDVKPRLDGEIDHIPTIEQEDPAPPAPTLAYVADE